MRVYRPHLRALRNVHAVPRTTADDGINAFVVRAPERRARSDGDGGGGGGGSGVLAGRGVAVKDNICTKSFATTCASVMLRDFQPGYNATVVDLLEHAGAHVVGKTNCDEFGMGSLNVHSAHGPVVNPFDPAARRAAGGSSGGSAAAVAAGQCFAALATDTGGSTRLPASYCGVVGLKPSYGLLSRWGVVAFADSLDTVGIIAARVGDVRRVLDVVAQFDEKDPTSVPESLRAQAHAACRAQMASSYRTGLHGLRIGIPQEYFPAELHASLLGPCRAVLRHLEARGAALVPVSLPSTPYALSAYYVLASAEASSNMARYDGVRYGTFVSPPEETDKSRTANVYAHSRSHGFGREVQKRILLGTYALTADAFDNYFLQAQRLRRLVCADFDRAFRVPNVVSAAAAAATPEAVDVLVHPSAIRTAPSLSEAASQGIETYVQDVLTVPASLAGIPALSVPAGLGEDGWPVGVSVVGQWGCEDMVLEVGKAIEDACMT